MTRWPLIRNVTLFVAGLTGVTVLTIAWLRGHDPNAQLMLLFASMLGLPAFLSSDERRKDEDKDG